MSAAATQPEAPERRPAIVAVDDEPAVLAAVARDLRRGFAERYRVLRATSGAEALEILRQLRTRGDQVALLIADQRMPGMAGTEYLVEAREVVPDVKRVLLTAYADTEAAITAINDVALDCYLLKPWDPPQEQLFPVVEDLLTTWESGAALEAGGVRIVGHRFSRDSHDLRDFLTRNRVPARWLDVERRPAQEHYDLIVVGDGPAGLGSRRHAPTWMGAIISVLTGEEITVPLRADTARRLAVIDPAGSGANPGLATARRIVVDRHNGSLSVQSAAGRTTFLVRLPLP